MKEGRQRLMTLKLKIKKLWKRITWRQRYNRIMTRLQQECTNLYEVNFFRKDPDWLDKKVDRIYNRVVYVQKIVNTHHKY